MKRTLILAGLLASALRGWAAVPAPPTTLYTRGLLVATNAAEARTYLGVSGSGSATNAPVISQNGTNGGLAINFTNSPTVTWALSGSNWTATASSAGITNGGLTATVLPVALNTNALGDSAFSSVGTNGSLTGNFTANGAAFATTPTVNGSPVLTNAPAQVFTNDAGVIHPVDLTVTTIQFGPDDTDIDVYFQPTANTNGYGNRLHIFGGSPGISGGGGSIEIAGGDGIDNNDGGEVTITSGNGAGTGVAGNLQLSGNTVQVTASADFTISATTEMNLLSPIVKHSGLITLSGNTNEYTDNGSQLLRNGSSIGDSLWTETDTVLQNINQTNNFAQLNFDTGNVILSSWPSAHPTQPGPPYDIAGWSSSVLIGNTFLPAGATMPSSVVITPSDAGLEALLLQDSVLLGHSAGGNATNLNRVVAIGYLPATGILGSSNSVFIGTATGPAFGEHSTNGIYIGTQAASPNSPQDVIAIGHNTSVSADDAIAIGHLSTNNFARSTAIGWSAQTTAEDQIRLGTNTTTVSIPGGIAVSDTTAAVNIAATGWTNTFGKNAVVYFDGTAVTATVFNGAGTSVYTNAVATTGMGTVMLQPSGKVILSGTGVTGRATVF